MHLAGLTPTLAPAVPVPAQPLAVLARLLSAATAGGYRRSAKLHLHLRRDPFVTPWLMSQAQMAANCAGVTAVQAEFEPLGLLAATPPEPAVSDAIWLSAEIPKFIAN